jgi:hypothetical protein
VKLPLVDEVRSAEEVALEAQRAYHDSSRVEAALRAVRMLLEEASPPPLTVGVDEVREVSASWPELAHLGVGLGGSLDDRRARLEALLAYLRPLGLPAAAHFAALEALQHRQQEELSAPRYRRSVRAIQQRVDARGALEAELLPVESELVLLGLLETVLATWSERAAAADGPMRGAILTQLVASVAPLLDGVAPTVRGGFGAAPTAADWTSLAERALERRTALEGRAVGLRRRRDQLVSWHKARLG